MLYANAYDEILLLLNYVSTKKALDGKLLESIRYFFPQSHVFFVNYTLVVRIECVL